MSDDPIDELDRQILHLLQQDARRNTDTDIASATDVTSTTVSNRIRSLEDRGVIRGYYPDIDYERAGYPLMVLFVGSASVTERTAIARRILDGEGIVNVRELMSGEKNVHVKAVAESTRDVETITEQLDEHGLRSVSSNIISRETFQPWDHFHAELFDEDSSDAP